MITGLFARFLTCVSRTLMKSFLKKLIANSQEIHSKILFWITNFLNNRKQRVVADGSFSNYADVESGVPQGTVLGPLLFLLHINDLPSCVNSKVRLFSDDCLLYREIKNNQDQIDM